MGDKPKIQNITVHIGRHCKSRRDAGQFAIFARLMYPTYWKLAVEGYEDATSVPYGYLLVALKPDQDE